MVVLIRSFDSTTRAVLFAAGCALLGAGLVWPSTLSAQDFVPVPSLSSRVTDLTGTLSATQKNQLEQRLAAFEEAKGAQIAVLLVPSTQPESIEQYSIRVVEEWKLGRADVDDGVLFLVAKNDRRMRIEVGYGLEGALPDITAKRIISDVVAPEFRSGDFAGGINAGVDGIIAAVQGEPLPEPDHKGGSSVGSELANLAVFGGVFQMGALLVAFLGSMFLHGRSAASRVRIAAIAGGVVLVIGIFVSGFFSALILGVIVFAFLAVERKGGRSSSGAYVGGGGFSGGFGGGSFGGGGFGGGGFGGGGGGFGGGGASGGW